MDSYNEGRMRVSRLPRGKKSISLQRSSELAVSETHCGDIKLAGVSETARSRGVSGRK